MRRGFKRTDYRIERKNKFVNLENFLLWMVMHYPQHFGTHPRKTWHTNWSSSSEIIIKLYVGNKTTNYSLQ